MQKIKDYDSLLSNDEIGLVMWKLESIEKFYPCFNSLIKKE